MNEVVNFHVWMNHAILQQTCCRANYFADILFQFPNSVFLSNFKGSYYRVEILKSYVECTKIKRSVLGSTLLSIIAGTDPKKSWFNCKNYIRIFYHREYPSKYKMNLQNHDCFIVETRKLIQLQFVARQRSVKIIKPMFTLTIVYRKGHLFTHLVLWCLLYWIEGSYCWISSLKHANKQNYS